MKILKPCIFVLSAMLVACGTGKEIVEDDEVTCPIGILVEDMSEYENSASVSIENVELDGDILQMKISYSGGCKDHQFKLIGALFIQKSLPPKRGIKLFHNSNDDNCREFITEELCFDISNFAYEGGGEIKLLLEGYDQEISYTPEVRED